MASTPPSSATPLDRVAVYMDGLRAALLRHPWAAALAGTRPLLGPNALAHAENVHAVLVACGFTGADLSAAAATVTNHVIASVATQAAARHGDGAEVRRALAVHLHAHADRYPTLAVHPPAIEDDWDGHYLRGRDLLLAGLAAHADTRRQGGSG